MSASPLKDPMLAYRGMMFILALKGGDLPSDAGFDWTRKLPQQEVIPTAAAYLRKVLKKAGLDLHWLADLVERQRALSGPAASRAGKCIRLLSSDRPGEVSAAANMLGKTLAQEKLDFDWLADLVNPPPPPSYGELYQKHASGGFAPAWSTDLEAAKYCLANIERLDQRHHKFIRQMATNCRGISSKQRDYLKSLYERLR